MPSLILRTDDFNEVI